jgi:hypothetical protein
MDLQHGLITMPFDALNVGNTGVFHSPIQRNAQADQRSEPAEKRGSAPEKFP